MYSELERTLADVPAGLYKHVTCSGLWGTYDDGLAWLKQAENAARPKAILSLGSSIGNFTPEEAIPFISQFAAELRDEDLMLVALDGCQEAEKVYHAYNDQGDVTHNFTLNGLKHANKLLGHNAFELSDWEAHGEYDTENSRHRAFVVPKTDVTVEGVQISKGEKIQIEESNKVPVSEAGKWWDSVDVLAKQSRRASSVMERGRDGHSGLEGAGSTLDSACLSNEEGSYACKCNDRPFIVASDIFDTLLYNLFHLSSLSYEHLDINDLQYT